MATRRWLNLNQKMTRIDLFWLPGIDFGFIFHECGNEECSLNGGWGLALLFWGFYVHGNTKRLNWEKER